MNSENLAHLLNECRYDAANKTAEVEITDSLQICLYPNSVQKIGEVVFFIARSKLEKSLWILADAVKIKKFAGFEGQKIHALPKMILLQCPLSHNNAEQIRSLFDFTRAKLIGSADSFGFGDRLGIANPAHVRAASKSKMSAVFAQQSIRELQRTHRKPAEVLDAATWAVFQEGYMRGFGADADHLKTTDDIDLMVRAGFTMFTIDPGDNLFDAADSLPQEEVSRKLATELPDYPGEKKSDCISRYAGQKIQFTENFELIPETSEVERCLLKYANVIAMTLNLYNHLKQAWPDHPSEVELSVDETDSVTTAFEHYFIVNELKRRGVTLMSLAPRFVGRFEKGVDYIGNLDEFVAEYKKHQLIAQKLGPYKIGFHSGSDKFQVYAAAAGLGIGRVHVKTAGTSYLEALRTVAACDPTLFREILDFSRNLYEQEKKTYHVSAQLARVSPAMEYGDEQLLRLFEDDDARQVMHVTFGQVLTAESTPGNYLFKDRILDCLVRNEETHYAFLTRHFARHLRPFDQVNE